MVGYVGLPTAFVHRIRSETIDCDLFPTSFVDRIRSKTVGNFLRNPTGIRRQGNDRTSTKNVPFRHGSDRFLLNSCTEYVGSVTDPTIGTFDLGLDILSMET